MNSPGIQPVGYQPLSSSTWSPSRQPIHYGSLVGYRPAVYLGTPPVQMTTWSPYGVPANTSVPLRNIPVADTLSAGLLANAKRPSTTSAHEHQTILMQPPWRFLGTLNELAETLSDIIPKWAYKSLWIMEFGYIAAESWLSAQQAAKLNSQTGDKGGKLHTFLSRLAFHSLATALIPTILISGLNVWPFAKHEEDPFKGLLGGIKGTTKSILKYFNASGRVLKYTPAVATFIALPVIISIFDPLIERGMNRLFKFKH